ncbi:MAG TPA: DUF3095 domain-containing protein [Bacteroidota bacterium]
MSTESFYVNLPVIQNFIDVSNPEIYTPFPDDWNIVVTDVKDSTRAIAEGGYKVVNLLGASSIIAMLNLTKSLSLPFVFGGDGATLCIPNSLVGRAKQSLVATRLMAKEIYGLDLRVGIIPLEHIRRNGFDVLVARYRVSENFVQAVFSGGGLQFAEELLKDPSAGSQFRLQEGDAVPDADFSGLECRWKNVPSAHGEVVTVIIQAIRKTAERKNATYKSVIRKIAQIYGTDAMCHPVREDDLTMTLSEKQLSGESRIRSYGKGALYRVWYWFRIRFGVLSGWYYMKTGRRTKRMNWGDYKRQLVANTDYRKFDDKLRQVLSGTTAQREELTSFLENQFKNRELVFGIHAAPTALVTCLIFNYNGAHVHLVDSDNGGYALAAVQLKSQLKQL